MRKNLGQHFLNSRDIARAAVEALSPHSGDIVVEIGPGTGILTEILLEKEITVVAIEKDPALVTKLKQAFAPEINSGQLEVVQDDIRNFEPTRYTLKAKRYKLIGNIPYYITGTILRLTLSARPQPTRVVFMVQKEVAERICGSRRLPAGRQGKESILSVSVKAYGTPRYVRTVKRGSFNPPPRVDSALVVIENISRDFFENVDEDKFFALVRKGFAHKRKLLRKNLGMDGRTFGRCDIDARARAETLALEQWKCLVSELE